jgi:ferric iron reductase protein FhuF
VTPADPAEVVAALDRAENPLLHMGISADGTRADRLDPAVLVDAVGAWLGTGERRVAASMVVLGYSARLLGPTLAVLLRDGILLDTRPANVRYSYAPDHGFRLSLTEPSGWRGAPLDAWRTDVIDGHLSMVIAAVHADVPVATALLWGNVASGIAATVRTLAAHGTVPVTHARPVLEQLLATGPLTNSGRLRDLAFTRRTCCLYYRIDGGGTCGDCPLTCGDIRRRSTPRSG